WPAHAPTVSPPNTTFAITRCTLIGIQVALAIACHSLIVVGSVVGVMSRGGDIMYVSHAFAMNITIVPQTLSTIPSVQWPSFRLAYKDPVRRCASRDHRDAQHDRGDHQVRLRRDPHERPRADHGELAVGVSRVGRRLQQQQGAVGHKLSATKNGRFFEKSIGIALRTSASSSGVTSRRPWRRAHDSTRCITTPRTNDGMRATRSRAAGLHVSAGWNSSPYAISRAGSTRAVSPVGSYTHDGSAASTSPSSAEARGRHPPHRARYSQTPHLPPSAP